MDDEDPWGEEPAWAQEDGGATSSERDLEGWDDGDRFGAQHILVLIDCRPSMFVPCIPVSNESSDPNNGDKKISPFDAALMACEKVLRLRVHHVATSKAGKRDGVGILLYGTKQRPVATPSLENNEDDRKQEISIDHDEEQDSDDTDDEDESSPLSSAHTLLPIAPPGIQAIRSLRDCLPDRDRGLPRKRNLEEEYADTDEESGPSHVAQRMGHITLCPLRSALHESSKAFVQAKCVKKHATISKIPPDAKTVWIFTNEDDPCGGNEDEKKLVVIVAKDAVESGIDLQVWPLPRPDGAPFSRKIFFQDITTTRDDFQSFLLERQEDEDGAFDLDDMIEDVLQQWKKVRRVSCLPLLLPDWRDRPDDPGIMVDLFSFVQAQRKPQSVTIHQLTNKMTQKTTQLVTKDTGEVIADGRAKPTEDQGMDQTDPEVNRIRTFARFGDDRVPLSREELVLIKKQSNATDNASLILLGFKPLDALRSSQRVDRSFLVYPNDDVVKGSKVAFANLYAAMIQKEVVAICELLQRTTGTSRLVVLYPQQERRELVGTEERSSEKQATPPGLVLVHLPFEDDCRAVQPDLGAVATEELVEAAGNLIQNQNLDGVEFGYSFENAALSRFWGYVESVAIGTPLKDDDDETMVDYESVKQVAGEQIEAFRGLLPEDDEAVGITRKRKLGIEDDCDWVDLYQTKSLSNCTAPLLKKYLRDNGLKLSGKKDDLIERIVQHMEEELSKKENDKPSVKLEE